MFEPEPSSHSTYTNYYSRRIRVKYENIYCTGVTYFFLIGNISLWRIKYDNFERIIQKTINATIVLDNIFARSIIFARYVGRYVYFFF